ncbi:bifunctional diguanylate cyclase/phosphohydrolase [Paenibacillus koleovorans]|uniref:bifunctional diguanylate cyclase/phosphohydrolase n=1 Tax=Paenibacillus koleovorans TaxID=121608 RepID=UPI000FD9F66F|nr:diguanylate cyclase [Paenibacillus koleovorans]
MSRNPEYHERFEREMSVITRNRLMLSNHLHSECELLQAYRSLLLDYERLSRTAKKIYTISDAQGKMLKQRENDIQSLLDHANQGFLSVGQDSVVNKGYSKECIRIFGKRIGGADFTELLWEQEPETGRWVKAQLQLALDPAQVEPERLLGELPSLIRLKSKRIAAEYKLMDQSDGFSIDQERLVMVILTDVTHQLESEEKLRHLSSHDSLTSLYNRAYMERFMLEQAGQLEYSLVVIDMNGMKLANDMFGHLAGDRLLVRTAALLRQVFRAPALIARWGGDEFVVLLPHAGELVREELEQLLKKLCRESEADPIRLSMAIGGATLLTRNEPFDSVYIRAEKMMYKHKLLESKQVRKAMLNGISEALFERGLEDESHSERLTNETIAFAVCIGIPQDSHRMQLLRDLIKLHDAGNLTLPGHILSKTGDLDEVEWEIVKSHSDIGYRMAQSIGEWELAEAILGIHERWDGKGYLYGLAGEQIPYLSRLFAIVDAYDIMVHEQVYKKARTPYEALQELEQQAGKQFDPGLVAAFIAWKQ